MAGLPGSMRATRAMTVAQGGHRRQRRADAGNRRHERATTRGHERAWRITRKR